MVIFSLIQVDRILIFDNGAIVDEGSLEDLQKKHSKYYQEIAEFIGKKEKDTEVAEEKEKEETAKKYENDGKLIKKEKSAEGRVDVKHYKYYLKSMNVWLFMVVLVYFFLSEAFKVKKL